MLNDQFDQLEGPFENYSDGFRWQTLNLDLKDRGSGEMFFGKLTEIPFQQIWIWKIKIPLAL